MTPEEKIKALFALSTELLKALKAYDESRRYAYHDGLGFCVHCDQIEYRPHDETCPVVIVEKLIPKAREVLESME